MKNYKPAKNSELSLLNEPSVTYGSLDDSQALTLIQLIRRGLHYSKFHDLYTEAAFSLSEWSKILHISERTMQRYETENKTFDPVQSEKIIQIAMLHKYGISVFGNSENFHTWLYAKNIALGGISPKDLLDSSFGIDLIKDELGRIEHGVLA
jgi:putative toxin-antitoxin system antitoxin component (TIGR02293 family)